MKKSIKSLTKEQKIIIAIVITIAVITIIICLWFNRKNKVEESFVTIIETETLMQETVPESSQQDSTQAIEGTTVKNPPKVKPVGTTKPIEKEEVEVTKPVYQPPIDYSNTNLKLLDVPYINQKNKYPTGCESISAVMALNYAGYNISPEEYIDNYLPKGQKPFRDETGELFGDDPRECFLGNPYEKSGWGCYAPVIYKGLNKVINHNTHKVLNLTGSSMKDLCSKCIDNNYPVIIWATQGMAQPRTGKTWYLLKCDGTFTWISPNHCLLLVGYDNSYYYFNDPLEDKNYRYEKDVVESRYSYLGKQALAIVDYVPETTTATTKAAETCTQTTETTVDTTKSTEQETLSDNAVTS